MAEQQFLQLPDDHVQQATLIGTMDNLLGQAALIEPDTPEAFAVKARIAREYGDTGPAGDLVLDRLLLDLMTWGQA